MKAPIQCVNAYLENDSTIVALSRDDSGSLRESRYLAEWVSYYRSKDIDRDMERVLRNSDAVRGCILEHPEWWRVRYKDRDTRESLIRDERSPFSRQRIKTYEGDVNPIMRWSIDNLVSIAKPKRAYIDIEADSRVSFVCKEDARVLAIAVVDSEGNKQKQVLEEDTDEAEKALLRWLWITLLDFDQVVAWNGDGYDFPVIWERSRQRRLKVNVDRWLWLDQMVAFKRMNMNASESGDEKQSFKLEDIGQYIVGKGKLKSPHFVRKRFGDRALGAISWDLWEAGGAFRELLSDYNVEDTDLLRAIEQETGYIDLFQTICEVCGVFGNTHSLHPTTQMDGFMMRLGKERAYHFDTKIHRENVQKFRGAYVMTPKANGIEKNVHVCDFKSLYPSVIRSWNMSPETKIPLLGASLKEGELLPEGVCLAPGTGIAFKTEPEGILPSALRTLMDMRDWWKREVSKYPPGTHDWHNAKRKSTAYKVIANSFFGGASSPYGRFYDPEVGESCTQGGVFLLKSTIDEIEKKGWVNLFGDTDSCMPKGPTNEEFAEFVGYCNRELYPKLLKDCGCKDNIIQLAYEKKYELIVFTGKKRYIARYEHSEGKPATDESKPEIKGLEYRRGDAMRMARMLQAEIIDMIVGRLGIAEAPVPTTDIERYHAVLSRVRTRVLTEALALDEVKMSHALSRSIKGYSTKVRADGYASSVPSHVQVAAILQKRGEEVREGTRIEYVVTNGAVSPMTVIPASDYTGEEVDRFYLWESRIYPPTQRLLEAAFPEHDWESWARVRPPKVRASARPLDGQIAFEGFTNINGNGMRVVSRLLAMPNRDSRVSPMNNDVDEILGSIEAWEERA